jgi:predicted metalloprotease
MSTTTHRTRKAALAATTTSIAASLALIAASAGPAAAAPSRAATMEEYLQDQLLDVHEYWTRFQAAVGGPTPYVYYDFPTSGEVVSGACGASNDNTMQYCPGDDQITFSQDLAVRLWNGQFKVNHDNHEGKVAGDFGVALMVAHEYAHNVQREVGLIPDQPIYKVINTELHADCWAGVWMNDSFYAGELEGTDVEEAVATMERLGDYEYTDPTTHGTPEQRASAFLYGYNAGVPSACDAVLTHAWL